MVLGHQTVDRESEHGREPLFGLVSRAASPTGLQDAQETDHLAPPVEVRPTTVSASTQLDQAMGQRWPAD
jgi:hypothetical protein